MNVTLRSYMLRKRLERKLQRRIARQSLDRIFRTESIHDMSMADITERGYLDDDIVAQLIVGADR